MRISKCISSHKNRDLVLSLTAQSCLIAFIYQSHPCLEWSQSKAPSNAWKCQTRGLYYKTFYGSNCCRIVISQSVCHFLSLPAWPNICRQDQEPTISAESSMGLYSGMIEPCPQISGQGGNDRKQQTLQLIMIRQQLLP